MNSSLIQKIRIYLSIQLAVFFVGCWVLYNLTFSSLVHGVIVFTLFLYAGLTLVALWHLPHLLRKSLNALESIIFEISRGNYSQEIDLDLLRQNVEGEFHHFAESIAKMLSIVSRFDALKKDKIQLQRNRLLAMLAISEAGFLVVGFNGEVLYMNEKAGGFFPGLEEGANLLGKHYSPDVENSLKLYLDPVFRTGKSPSTQIFTLESIPAPLAVRALVVKDGQSVPREVVVCFTTNLPQEDDVDPEL